MLYMSYTTLDPHKDVEVFLKTKPLSSYSKSLVKDIKMLSFYPEGMATPFGSFIYRLQRYPGDVDLLEEYVGTHSVEHVIKMFIRNLHRVVNDILKSKMHYFSEFKC